jgi:preprotein translocase subunit SecG
MAVLSVLLLVFFVIAAVLLVLMVLIQNEEGDSIGGIFAGGSGSAFGSRSGNVLTRTTSILGAIFLILSFGLALINRTPGGTGVEAAGRQTAAEADSGWWREDAAPASPSGDEGAAFIEELDAAANPAPVEEAAE